MPNTNTPAGWARPAAYPTQSPCGAMCAAPPDFFHPRAARAKSIFIINDRLLFK
ncbi:MAG: hypothetical protein HC908_07135 [Calothrix sp. SM1_7_51]|nr:hypothetical protein [Calothrix sp. SM1_7_51]